MKTPKHNQTRIALGRRAISTAVFLEIWANELRDEMKR